MILLHRAFKYSVEEVDLSGENTVDAEWMAYLGAFSYLHSLNVAECYRINNPALWPLAGLHFLLNFFFCCLFQFWSYDSTFCIELQEHELVLIFWNSLGFTCYILVS